MSKTRIEPGDIVNVNMHHAGMTLCAKAEVINVPQATGESWAFRDVTHGTLIYCTEGITITRIEPDGSTPQVMELDKVREMLVEMQRNMTCLVSQDVMDEFVETAAKYNITLP